MSRDDRISNAPSLPLKARRMAARGDSPEAIADALGVGLHVVLSMLTPRAVSRAIPPAPTAELSTGQSVPFTKL
jgi:hypothetical protein